MCKLIDHRSIKPCSFITIYSNAGVITTVFYLYAIRGDVLDDVNTLKHQLKDHLMPWCVPPHTNINNAGSGTWSGNGAASLSMDTNQSEGIRLTSAGWTVQVLKEYLLHYRVTEKSMLLTQSEPKREAIVSYIMEKHNNFTGSN
jgi:hypothetical protein